MLTFDWDITKKEYIKRGNILLAEFENLSKDIGLEGARYEHSSVGFLYAEELPYLTDFEWLIRVVIKIEKLNDDIVKKAYVNIHGNVCSINTYFDITSASSILRADKILQPNQYSARHSRKSKHEAVWLALVNFISWYNDLKLEKDAE